MNPDNLKFDERGLIPAVVQDADSGRVLMLGYMNRESLGKTMDSGQCWFFSRSRGRLWLKGETSGHYLNVVSVDADCDGDALLVRAHPQGPTCHTGEQSCFFDPLLAGPEPFTLHALYTLIQGRKRDKKEGSYTTYLFDKGLDKILKKVGEESTEVIVAGKGGDRAETIYEIADLCYHVLVLMAQMDIPVEEVMRELAGRHVVDKKTKQETVRAQESGQ
ncbi:MAG: bifunctional phosphoribosyl-AMP cyclohydrolase/phosphoribosyl-ATP diphosphatase HisIE [Clostridiales bacterium]|nr:bifunctional phosphoribosyl-AMP cyclohydrolase/phosphoribosyl-ATP diphosphatase HisIE [Clostridiales bacterium]